MQQIGEIANKHGYTNKKREKQDLNINAIPNNTEKYMAFMLGNHLTFIDSFQFMSFSLDKLVSNLPKDDLIYTSEAFKGKRLNLMSQKGVYPYDFMDSFEKFNQRELPNKDQFYSILNDQHLTDDEYDHANKVWKYMAFMLGNHLTFIDSFRFMSFSLDKLVSNLPKDDLIYTSKAFKGKRLNLMSQKGVYPYDFMDSFEKFNQRELPNKDQFYSILNDQHITDDEYDHANKVWNTFMIKTMGESHDLYLVSDVLLLTDVFENFRKTCMQYYKLDPCHYFTSPGLSWDAMLKMTNIKLELMTDIDMFQFIKKGMRGGVSYIANRYGNANKYMKEYNEKAPSKYIMYLDANNLYGWAMSQYLPTGNFKWMTDKEISKIDLGKYKADGKKGLILEVDLEYPQELHDIHNDCPVAPEKVKVSNIMLSAYCKKTAEKYNISIGLVSKLIPTLRDKKEYVLQYRNLQLYLDLGLKIKKVH